MFKKKFKRIIYDCIKHDGLLIFVAIIIMILFYIKNTIINKQETTLFDYTLCTSLILTMLLSSIANFIKKILLNKLEDSAKLTTDYQKLVSKYVADFITYDNTHADTDNLKKLQKLHQTKFSFPVICDYKLNHCAIDIHDSTQMYELPDIVKIHFDELLSAHSTSTVYNQLNIRVDSWSLQKQRLIINTSRTSYYSSLLTNRAIDYTFENGLTLRNYLEYGPFLHSLAESHLSNHLGFNGFVESADGYIPFIKRGKNLSIGKFTYGNSIGASLKTKYALDESGNLSAAGLIHSILAEIADELKIPSEHLEPFSCEKNLIAAYRDVIEGGKPQLLFYIHSNWSKKEIEENFYEGLKKKRKNSNKSYSILEDGSRFLWIPKIALAQICIAPDMLIYQKKKYPMVPSASACVVMLIEHLKEGGKFL